MNYTNSIRSHPENYVYQSLDTIYFQSGKLDIIEPKVIKTLLEQNYKVLQTMIEIQFIHFLNDYLTHR